MSEKSSKKKSVADSKKSSTVGDFPDWLGEPSEDAHAPPAAAASAPSVAFAANSVNVMQDAFDEYYRRRYPELANLPPPSLSTDIPRKESGTKRKELHKWSEEHTYADIERQEKEEREKEAMENAGMFTVDDIDARLNATENAGILTEADIRELLEKADKKEEKKGGRKSRKNRRKSRKSRKSRKNRRKSRKNRRK